MHTTANNSRPVALVILEGWGYAPRTEGNAIAMAHTPYYDEICRKYPMTTLAAAGEAVGRGPESTGRADVGHLNIGAGRVVRTEPARIRDSIASGEFQHNPALKRAFDRVTANGGDVHLIGLISDAGIHSSTDSLFALLRMARDEGVKNAFVHCILDGVDVPPRTADVYVEALEIKLADIGIGKIATLCGRFLAMDAAEHWERTARVFTMLVHAEGERATDAVNAVRNSFLRGISDEFVAPIVIEAGEGRPLATVKNGDLVIFFNHRGDAMRQLVRSLCIPEGQSGAKPDIDTVCLTEYDRSFNLPAAFRGDPEKNTLTEMLSTFAIPNVKIAESYSVAHMIAGFESEGGGEEQHSEQIHMPGSFATSPDHFPESQSFRITDRLLTELGSTPGVVIASLPAVGMMAETGNIEGTRKAIQFVDTCLGGIVEKVESLGGVAIITSTHGNCESMIHYESGEPDHAPTANPVPFHLIDPKVRECHLREDGSLADVAPTILGILGIEKPAEMTGSDLRIV